MSYHSWVIWLFFVNMKPMIFCYARGLWHHTKLFHIKKSHYFVTLSLFFSSWLQWSVWCYLPTLGNIKLYLQIIRAKSDTYNTHNNGSVHTTHTTTVQYTQHTQQRFSTHNTHNKGSIIDYSLAYMTNFHVTW